MVPVIMVTSLDDAESRMRGLEAGADEFISKPVNLAELRVRLHKVLSLNRLPSCKEAG
jgi:putative two-component system response regulator